MYANSAEGPIVMDRPAVLQWDYAVHSIHARNDQVLEQMLKDLGKEGWELISVHVPMGNEYHCVFKKRIA